MFTNWQTTLMGAGTILFAVLGMAIGKLNWETASGMIAAGAGLILAKDAGK